MHGPASFKRIGLPAPRTLSWKSCPPTAVYGRATKLPLYAEAGVPEVWLVDWQTPRVEILKLQGKKYQIGETFAENQTLTSKLFPAWQLPLTELFDFRGRF